MRREARCPSRFASPADVSSDGCGPEAAAGDSARAEAALLGLGVGAAVGERSSTCIAP